MLNKKSTILTNEEIKQQYFYQRFKKGKADIKAGRIVDGETAFQKMMM